ncbi:MAG: hypothetical protein WDN28_00565 [Chthoniobacter sp.]
MVDFCMLYWATVETLWFGSAQDCLSAQAQILIEFEFHAAGSSGTVT